MASELRSRFNRHRKTPLKVIKAKEMTEDYWGRRRAKDTKTGDVYVLVDGVWHSTTDEGEPLAPLRGLGLAVYP